MYESSAYMEVCAACVYLVPEEVRTSDSLELELGMVTIYHVGAGSFAKAASLLPDGATSLAPALIMSV